MAQAIPTGSVEIEGGMDYARLRRHYPFQDYHRFILTAAAPKIPYVVGTNVGIVGLGAKAVLVFSRNNPCWIAFNADLANLGTWLVPPAPQPGLLYIPAGVYIWFHPHDAFIIFANRDPAGDTTLDVWMEI